MIICKMNIHQDEYYLVNHNYQIEYNIKHINEIINMLNNLHDYY